MRLVERGRLSLDDGLGSLLPDFPTHGHTVTLRHLLNHTSGIKSYTSMGEAWRKLWPLELSHEELLTLVRDEPFDFAPGEKWAYNNTAYYMLGMIIEMDAGVSYAEHMHSQIFAPLRLLRTRYDSNRDLIRNRAQGYAFEGGTLTNDEPLGMSQPGGAGGLLSTGGDLVRWSMALTAGQVVSADSFALMSTPTILPDGTSTGYGFGLAVDEFEGRRRISHGGGIMGFNSMLLFLPEGNVHVGVISNGETVRSDKIAEAIARAALGIEKATVHDEPLAPELMARIAGGYRFEERPMDVRVWDDGGRAMVQASGPGQGAFRILYQGAAAAEDGGEVFRAEFDTDVRLVFAADGASFVLHQGGRRLTARRAGG
jgi:CubicO group peptidase (beta-lactamase class C family)